MALLLCLSILIYHTDTVLSLCSVDYCDPSYCNGSSCDKCFDGYFRHVIEDFCYKCYLYCKQCNGYDSQCYNCFHPGCSSDVCDLANCTTAGCSGNTNVPCSSCPDGFYLSNHRCYRCNKVNCKCSSASNCIGCLLGYYGTSNACIGKCPSNCISCKNSINCDECISGKYGQTCETECINTCQDGICDKESGTCLAGCASNEYFHSGGICRPCPSRCNSCSNVTFCTDCKTYFMWGSICQYECTGCYSMCTMKDGCSLGCYSNYYLSYNVKKNGYECTHCPADCQTCTNMTLCQTCVQGRWGNICQYNCTGCSRECDALKGCVSGCLPGYYREASETGSVCLSCSKECETCTNATICQTCKCETDISDVCNGKSEFQVTSSDNNPNNGATIGLAVIVGITVLLLTAAITANVILLKKLRALPLQTSGDTFTNTTLGGHMDINTYQDLNRRGPDERTYSSLTHEYENKF